MNCANLVLITLSEQYACLVSVEFIKKIHNPHTNTKNPSDSLRKLLWLDEVIRVVDQDVCKRLWVGDQDAFSVELSFVPDHAVVRHGVDPFAHWITGWLSTNFPEVAVPEGGTLDM